MLNRVILSAFVAATCSIGLAAAGDLRLIDAVRAQNLEHVRALLAERVDVNATQGDGATALHWAVHRDDSALVDTLLRAGARANVADDTGATPLFLACTNRNADIVGRLLSANANPNRAAGVVVRLTQDDIASSLTRPKRPGFRLTRAIVRHEDAAGPAGHLP